MFKKMILPVLLAGIWISISEFFRNEWLLKSYWEDHYHALGLQFPSAPVNGAVWGLWSFLFAAVICILSKKFQFIQTILLSWFIGFVLMWVVVGNMGVLPLGILGYAIPLSFLETYIAAFIIVKISGKQP